MITLMTWMKNKSFPINKTQFHNNSLITNQLTNKKITIKIAFHLEMQDSKE